jgi:hypothetical protein
MPDATRHTGHSAANTATSPARHLIDQLRLQHHHADMTRQDTA